MWNSFNQRHSSSDSAFEALCCQLFERWCRREYGDLIRSFYFLDGCGGDGGVEAFAILTDESVVGLQAKAWWKGFLNPQKKQIEKSLESATKRHPKLTRYIVCCPLNLLASKGQGNTGISQLDRWQSFEAEAKTNYTDVALEYRGQSGILEWLQQPDSETIRAYWFDEVVISREHWRQLFERVKSSWMDLRYLPDLHVSTVLDEELGKFINSPKSADDLKARIQRLADSLEQKRERINNLINLPGSHSSQALSDCVALVGDIDFLQGNLHLQLTEIDSRGVSSVDFDPVTKNQIWQTVSRIWKELGGSDKLTFSTSATQSVLDAVKGLEDDLDAFQKLTEMQQRLRRMLLVMGDAGTGKTQTVTKMCDVASGAGVPLLVLPARAFDPHKSWSEILGEASNRPSWTAEQVLDALEASSFYAWRESTEPRSAPRRAILALDGPDESIHPEKWHERLKELAELCKGRLIIATIVTTRPESSVWLPLGDERFSSLRLQAPAIADRLPEIFNEYAREYNITVPSPAGVAWALRTPLAIRMFAEVYQGRAIAPGQDLVITLAELFKLKLTRLDGELHLKNRSWPKDRDLSLGILDTLVHLFLAEKHCSYEKLVKAVSARLTHIGITIENAAKLFERTATQHGLIEIYCVATEPMKPDRTMVRPGFNALLDYILAKNVATRVYEVTKSRRLGTWLSLKIRRHFPKLDRYKLSLAKEQIFPQVIHGRQNSQSLVVSMLLKENFSLLESGLWRQYMDEESLEKYHARGINDLRPNQASAYIEWVKHLLGRDMLSCRMLVAELILPSSRVPSASFGVEFLHQEFTRMNLAERDLVWSGPDWLPANCGGAWEGNGSPIHDSITLREDDSAVSTPILVAWVTSSVIYERQRQAIAGIAKWGSKRPAELARLLSTFATVDDVQVIESVAVAAAGAVLELVEHGSADDLARTVHANFFEKREEKDHPSVVARHAARLVIERAFSIGTELPISVRDDATPPYPSVGPRLPIDSETVTPAVANRQGGGDTPLSSDLDWYVSKKAYEPFFEQVVQRTGKAESRRYSETPRQILDAFAAGSLLVEPAIHKAIAEEIETRIEIEKQFLGNFKFESKENSEEMKKEPSSARESEEKVTEPIASEEFSKAFRSITKIPPALFSPEAEEILKDYACEVSESETLNPAQFGKGLIVALVKKWGWNNETFYGDPRGQAPGEILGADIAILRQNRQASHGSRSSVATFGEKYVWSAVNVISSFLSDRLPGKDDKDSKFKMYSNQSALGSGMPDPLAGYRSNVIRSFRPPWNPAGIASTLELSETKQPERGIQWLDRAEWPNPANWFAVNEDKNIVLSGFLSAKDHSIGIQIAAWASCIAVPRTQLRVIERDIKLAPSQWTRIFSVHDFKGAFGEGVYSPIRLAVWAPWVHDDEPETWHTLSDSGEPLEIPFLPLNTETYWEGTDGETSALSPSKLLRTAGGIIDCRGPEDSLSFVDKDREEVAYFQHLDFPEDWRKNNQHLQYKRSILFQALAEHDLVPVWGVRVYRELLPELRANGWVDQDGYWLVTTEDDGATFRSTLVDQKNRNHE